MSKLQKAAWCVGFLLALGTFLALSAAVFMLLWNFVMAGVFHLPALGFWHSLALVFLIGMIGSWFKSANSKS